MRRLATVILLMVGLSGCGGGGIGEACYGSAEEESYCVEGAICTQNPTPTTGPTPAPNGETYTCRQLCDVNADCEPGFVCRGLAASSRSSCQPEPTE
ncbi:MAG: hypothetical protein K8H88_27435 [Sandaracinaceae bacterium]|nr:hypothetical protein [Sandaracinaceae bacterium]